MASEPKTPAPMLFLFHSRKRSLLLLVRIALVANNFNLSQGSGAPSANCRQASSSLIRTATIGRGRSAITFLAPIFKRTRVAGTSPNSNLNDGITDECVELDAMAVLTYAEAAIFAMHRFWNSTIQAGNSVQVQLALNVADTSAAQSTALSAFLAACLHSKSGRQWCFQGANDSVSTRGTLVTIGSIPSELEFQSIMPLLDAFNVPLISLTPVPLHCGQSAKTAILRGLSSWTRLAAVQADLVSSFRWDAVLILASHDIDADSIANLESVLAKRQICVAGTRVFDYGDRYSLEQGLAFVNDFLTVTVVILASSTPGAGALFSYMKNNMPSSTDSPQKVWVGGEPWASSSVVFDSDFNIIASSSMLVTSQSAHHLDSYFQRAKNDITLHFSNVTVQSSRNSSENPWLCAAFEKLLNCTSQCHQHSQLNMYVPATSHPDKPRCRDHYHLPDSLINELAERSALTMLAFDYAQTALTRVLADIVDQYQLGENISESDFYQQATSSLILAALKRGMVTFETVSDGRAEQTLFTNNATSAEQYRISSIVDQRQRRYWGWWNGTLHINETDIPNWNWTNTSDESVARRHGRMVPVSTCAPPCPLRFEHGPPVYDLPSCCRMCFPCNSTSYSNGTTCIYCNPYQLQAVNVIGNGCLTFLPPIDTKSSNFLVVIAAAAALAGLLFVCWNTCFILRRSQCALWRYFFQYVVLFFMLTGYLALLTYLIPLDQSLCAVRFGVAKTSLLATSSVVLVRTLSVRNIKRMEFVQVTARALQRRAMVMFGVIAVPGVTALCGLLWHYSAKVNLENRTIICSYPGITEWFIEAYILFVSAMAAVNALSLISFSKMRTYSPRLVLVATLALFIVHLICSVVIYWNGSYRNVSSAIQLFFTIHPPWLAIVFTPTLALYREHTTRRERLS